MRFALRIAGFLALLIGLASLARAQSPQVQGYGPVPVNPPVVDPTPYDPQPKVNPDAMRPAPHRNQGACTCPTCNCCSACSGHYAGAAHHHPPKPAPVVCSCCGCSPCVCPANCVCRGKTCPVVPQPQPQPAVYWVPTYYVMPPPAYRYPSRPRFGCFGGCW